MLFKNILDKFNPGAKQLIGSSKAYLKSLQATSVASKVFIESLAKLAVNAHEGGTADIGKEIVLERGMFTGDVMVSLRRRLSKGVAVFFCSFRRLNSQHHQLNKYRKINV